MLILLGVSYGILSTLAQQSGPDAVLVTVQAVIHNARDYAAGRGVPTRVEFRFTEPNSNDQLPSTSMRLQYWSDEFNDWLDVPGREPIALPQGLYVCKGFPNTMPQLPRPPSDPRNVTQAQAQQWMTYQEDVLDAVAGHALKSGGTAELDNQHDEFYIVYGPAGYPIPNARLNTMKMQSTEVVGGTGAGKAAGLTLIRISGTRVSDYTFYVWNQNAGTRLIFQ
jgi:hypothetical protein